MDPSTSAAQNVQNQQTADQPVNTAQVSSQATPSDNTQSSAQSAPQVQSVHQPAQQKIQVSVGNVESEGGGAFIAESPDAGEDDEEEVQVAPQETKNNVVAQGAMANIEEEVEIQPSIPEFATGSPEIEKIVEKTPDQEKPTIPQVVKDAGVTHSGPGIIEVDQNNFGITKLPVTYQQAVVEEKKTDLHESKHWLMGMIMYIWRKVNPTLGTKEGIK